jgi:2-polyprenyl-6-methoxyphenol hydroxylase-like FAD-dependent oxidoreductase
MRGYDTIIVGARCAGAALAIELARAGQRVLVVEQGELGTDQRISTHAVTPAGMEALDALGVGDLVRAKCPPTRVMRNEMDGRVADITFRPGHEMYTRRHLAGSRSELRCGVS